MIDGARHDPAQCIDLFNQMSFSDPTDGRVARHMPQRIDIVGQQQGVHPHTSRCRGRFGTGVTATDDDHIKLFMVLHLDHLDRNA
ncbi:hypothetical protein WL1483_377 [Aeromonas schubertii]|uniref:Uncharacterized protein n=1 Tax=Aeromonas schubertii TaxID=652 RepID=A0A0S2SDN6_9GAMM|nr:hypothetical protein WL1483_377 [Aeromonas schubertii]